MKLTDKYKQYMDQTTNIDQIEEVLSIIEVLAHNTLDKYVDQFTVCDNNITSS